MRRYAVRGFLKRNVARSMIRFPVFLFTVHFFLIANVCAEPPKRIISLAPNTTEILFALGLDERIVGVTNFCDYPEEARAKPRIGGMSNPSLEAVMSLKPDIVVVTTDGNPKKFVERLNSLGIKTYVFRARRLTELPQGIRDMGARFGVRERAETLARKIEDLVRAARQDTTMSQQKKVLFIVWPRPLIVAGAGTLIDDAIRLVGAINIAGAAKVNYPKYSIEEILYQAPDVIFIGRGMGDIEKVSEGLLKRLGSVPAVKNNKVFYVSDRLYRLGPRTVEGVEEIAGHLD